MAGFTFLTKKIAAFKKQIKIAEICNSLNVKKPIKEMSCLGK